MPNQVDLSSSDEGATLDLEQPSVPQLTNRSIGYPMEELALVQHFKLPRKEDSVPLRLKERAQYFFRVLLTGIGRPLLNRLCLTGQVVVIRQVSPERRQPLPVA
jgi:hypothetical protein